MTVVAPACRAASGLGLLYLLVQLLLPGYIGAQAGFVARDFSWDMFSHRLSCEKLDMLAKVPGGQWASLPLREDFSSWAQVSRVLVPERLEDYARYVCAKLARAHGQRVALRFVAECREDRSHPLQVVDPTRDYCSERP